MAKSNRRTPSQNRKGLGLGIELEATFLTCPANSWAMVRPIAEELLCLYDDNAVRRMYRETFGLADDQPIPNIPVDWILAEATGTARQELQRAAETGRLEGLHFNRSAGRGSEHHTAIDFDWFAHDRGYGRSTLTVQIALADIPTARAREVEAFVVRFFDRVVAAGGVTSARGEPKLARAFRWRDATVKEHAQPELRGSVIDELVQALERDADSSITEPSMAMVLRPDHMERLGGRRAFVKRIERFAGPKLNWNPHIPEMPLLREYESGELLIFLQPGLLNGSDEFFFHLSVGVLQEWLAWLTCVFAEAGLLIWQAPDAAERLYARRQRHVRELDELQQPDRFEHPRGQRALREAQDSEFMARLWESPPAFIAPHAVALDNRRRSALERSRGGHGCAMTGFLVRRKGSDKPVGVWVTPWRHGDSFPVLIGGPTPKTALAVFDARRHGFDGEQRLSPQYTGLKPPEPYHCQRCGHDRFEVVTLFEYGDPEDYQDPQVAARPQDFFSWFELVATCAQCGKKKAVVSVECA